MPKLEFELPSSLTYHNAQHTQSVIEATEELALEESVAGEELMVLKTAALLHDAGFLTSYMNHEEASCEIAKHILPELGYSEEHLKAICGCIMATKLPQRPATKLEEIICDADLHYIGTDNYQVFAEKLYGEFKAYNVVNNISEWVAKQTRFLTAHAFFTAAARGKYEAKKSENLQALMGHYSIQKHGKKTLLSDALMMCLGVLVAGFALNGFLVPNHFFDGGVTGISLLIHEVYHINLGLVMVAMNVPFIIAAYRSVSSSFAVKMCISIVLLAICLFFIPYPVITSDKLLVSIFGGAFLGLGVGLVMRTGSALDGIEVLALYTLKRTSFTITEIILGLNILIFSLAAFRFGLESALYSILTYFTASRVIDYVIEGLQAYIGVTIISSHSDVIKYKLVNDMGRGITIYKGERGFLPGSFNVSSNVDIIFTVVTRLEMRRLKNLVQQTDPKAFIFAGNIREASGGVTNRRIAH